ncbi:hypothetical protein Tco_0905206 [Tanacetum coccineum]
MNGKLNSPCLDKNVASVGIDECVITRDEDDSVVKVAETMENNEGCSSAFGCVNENGSEVVIFDDEVIDLGSKKCNLTVYGQFSGCNMSFNEAMYHLRRMWNRENTRRPNAGKYEYRKRIEEVTNVTAMGVNNKESQKDVGNNTKKENNDVQNKTNTKESKNDKNSPKEGELKGISKSNRFTLLNELVDEDELVPSLNEREIDRKEIIDVMDDIDSEDVIEEVNGAEKSCLRNEVDGGRGLNTSEKKKEVQKLISEEKIKLMAIVNDNKGCRIMIGWDTNSVNVWVIDQSKQYMFLLVESLHRKTKFFYTVVYASNSGGERKDLWKSLSDQKHIVNGNPWAVSDDFNVTLAVNEHSSGSSFPSNDMKEFHECINDVELKDVNNSGFFFTWTKNLKNPDCKTLKKLDRIMVNEDFISKYPDTHGCFLLFLISDHSPAILIMKNGVTKKKKAFRSSTKELFTPLDNSKRVFRSKIRLFETHGLVESNSPEFDLFSDVEECSEEETTEEMTETMEQYMSTRGDYGSGVTRPKINTDTHFELKGQFLKELRDNTFSGSKHEDANEHIKKILEIIDFFHIPNITQDQIMLRAFPFLSKYCPPAHTAKKMEEINNFQQEPAESLFRAWERFKELLMKCSQHYLTDMYEHNETSRTRSTKTFDELTAIQAQLNNPGKEIKKVNEKVYAAQVRCELLKGPHYTKDCPLKEEGKTLEEAYYTQFGAPYQPEGQYRAAVP